MDARHCRASDSDCGISRPCITGRLGDSHGKSRAQVRPKPRHAQLAVNLAGSMAMFLIGTWQENKGD
ncbi:abortive infection family protein [Bosea sp. AS-1]|uniref:abortive infection family protein n=1 Tax=Bosea sp. AS-1 TaxID=2015316 RepID=UPI000B780160|nr:abortive infection family protein [Bosea sp. AS-1]